MGTRNKMGGGASGRMHTSRGRGYDNTETEASVGAKRTMKLTTRKTEKIALGNALRHGTSLNLEDFRFPPHPEICLAILAVRETNQPVGLRTVSDWLRLNGLLEKVGGTLYLAELMLAAEC